MVPSGDKRPGVTGCRAFAIACRERRAAIQKISAEDRYAAPNTIRAMTEVGCDSIHESMESPCTGIGQTRIAYQHSPNAKTEPGAITPGASLVMALGTVSLARRRRRSPCGSTDNLDKVIERSDNQGYRGAAADTLHRCGVRRLFLPEWLSARGECFELAAMRRMGKISGRQKKLKSRRSG